MLYQKFSIFDIMGSPTLFKVMLESQTKVTVTVIDACFKETASSQKIVTLQWPTDQDFLTFRTDSEWIDQNKLEAKL